MAPTRRAEAIVPTRDDLSLAASQGSESDIVEIGELVAGTRLGRTSPDQITLYRSVGVAVQDATAATLVLAAARRAGAGRELSLTEVRT